MDTGLPATDLPPPVPVERQPTIEQRIAAAIEVLLCSDYPTQLLLGATFAAMGFRPQTPDGTLDITFVVVLSLLDTVLLLGLIVVFLLAHGERPRDVFLGSRPWLKEARAGIPMTFVTFLIAVVVLVTI